MRKMKSIFIACYAITSVLPLIGASITDDLTGWTGDAEMADIATAERPENGNGPYFVLPIPTSPFYYEVDNEGEGDIQFWIHDPAKCLDKNSTSYGTKGPRWGLQTSTYLPISIGIDRSITQSGCLGYSIYSPVSASAPLWFNDGVRDTSWKAGWYKWTVNGTWDDISFVVHDIDYDQNEDPGITSMTHGDCQITLNESSNNGAWGSVFGNGWKAFYLAGDNPAGLEEVGVYIVGGSGVFSSVADHSPIKQGFSESSWGRIKKLFR